MKPGSKEKLRHREKSRILNEVYKNRTTILKIKNDLDLNVSRKIIRRILTSSPNVSYEKIERKPSLSNVNKLKRLDFARSYNSWNEEWRNIVWSDEKKWNLDGPDGKCKFWLDNRRKNRLQ